MKTGSMNKKTAVLLLASSLFTAQAAEVRFYSNFSEVRQTQTLKTNELSATFDLESINGMVPGTLTLEGVKIVSQLQTAAPTKNLLEAYEGQTVFLREGDKLTEVKLIRASDGTVQDLKTGRYRVGVNVQSLEFPSLPPLQDPGKVTVKFGVEKIGPATLSYLSRALSWSPRYTLSVDKAGVPKLESLADLRNSTSEDIKVDSSELVAGEVNLTESGQPYPMPSAVARGNFQADAVMAAPKIGEGVEGAGVYSFALSNTFTLPARSVYSLPFLTPKVTLERVDVLNTYFNPGFSKGKLNRLYRLKSDLLLPSGSVTVRDEGRLVGQARLSDLAIGEQGELYLGSDPDVSYARAVQTLTQDKKGASYRVTLTLVNVKKRDVAVEYTENFSGKVVLEGQAERVNEGLKIKGTIPAGGKLERSYTLKFSNE